MSFCQRCLAGRVSSRNPLALHFAGAGNLDRLQIVGVGSLHIRQGNWSATWRLEREKLTRQSVAKTSLVIYLSAEESPDLAE